MRTVYHMYCISMCTVYRYVLYMNAYCISHVLRINVYWLSLCNGCQCVLYIDMYCIYIATYWVLLGVLNIAPTSDRTPEQLTFILYEVFHLGPGRPPYRPACPARILQLSKCQNLIIYLKIIFIFFYKSL